MKRSVDVSAFLILTYLFGLTVEANGATNAPAAMIPPGLAPGSHFYVMFTTSTTIQGNRPLAEYDQLVNDAAAKLGDDRNNHDASLAGQWKAFIAYNDGVFHENRGNAVTGVFSQDTSAPVYRVDRKQIALNRADLCDGTILSAISTTESGLKPHYNAVWTGMNFDCTPAHLMEVASPQRFTKIGSTAYTDSWWLTAGGNVITALGNQDFNMAYIYAVSPLLQVPAPMETKATPGETTVQTQKASPTTLMQNLNNFGIGTTPMKSELYKKLSLPHASVNCGLGRYCSDGQKCCTVGVSNWCCGSTQSCDYDDYGCK